jgi:DnaJ-class molecular chaperone
MTGIDELDHYELLEIERGATRSELDRAYRTAQHTYEDDSLALYSVFEQRDAKEIRSRLDEAYRILSDPDLRAAYDGLLPAAPGVHLDPLEDLLNSVEDRGATLGLTSASEGLERFDPAEQQGSLDEVVEEYDALEEDGSGEFDGVRLRRNRLFRGYEIEDISDVTKVSRSHLRNLEDENFVDLPADVYVRGFLTAYAQTIGLDPKLVVPSYMARVQASRSDGQRGRFLGRR